MCGEHNKKALRLWKSFDEGVAHQRSISVAGSLLSSVGNELCLSIALSYDVGMSACSNKKATFDSTNQFYSYKIIHELSKANIPDARINKRK